MRRSRQEIEQLVIDAAIDLVQSEGMGVGLEGITYTRVFRHLEATTGQRVTRASVHERVWRDQADFQAALRDRIAAIEGQNIDPRVLDEATDVLNAALLTAEDPRVVLGDVLRRLASIDLVDQSAPLRQVGAAVKAMVALSDGAERDAAQDSVNAFRVGQAQRIEVLTGCYSRLLERLGAQIKPEREIDRIEAISLIVRAVDGLNEGLRVRAPFDDVDSTAVSLGATPATNWSLASIVGFALIDEFFDLPSAA